MYGDYSERNALGNIRGLEFKRRISGNVLNRVCCNEVQL